MNVVTTIIPIPAPITINWVNSKHSHKTPRERDAKMLIGRHYLKDKGQFLFVVFPREIRPVHGVEVDRSRGTRIIYRAIERTSVMMAWGTQTLHRMLDLIANNRAADSGKT